MKQNSGLSKWLSEELLCICNVNISILIIFRLLLYFRLRTLWVSCVRVCLIEHLQHLDLWLQLYLTIKLKSSAGISHQGSPPPKFLKIKRHFFLFINFFLLINVRIENLILKELLPPFFLGGGRFLKNVSLHKINLIRK